MVGRQLPSRGASSRSRVSSRARWPLNVCFSSFGCARRTRRVWAHARLITPTTVFSAETTCGTSSSHRAISRGHQVNRGIAIGANGGVIGELERNMARLCASGGAAHLSPCLPPASGLVDQLAEGKDGSSPPASVTRTRAHANSSVGLEHALTRMLQACMFAL